MSTKYKIRDQDKLYFVSFATINWIDVFARLEYKDMFVESLKYCIANKGLELFAWVLMTNHAHLIISTQGEKMEHILFPIRVPPHSQQRFKTSLKFNILF